MLPASTGGSGGTSGGSGSGSGTGVDTDPWGWPETSDGSTGRGHADDGGATAADDSACPAGSEGCACDLGECGFGLSCFEDVCLPEVECAADKHEPNDNESKSEYLGQISDEGGGTRSASGRLDGSPDWFHFHGYDVQGAAHQARATISANAGLELCIFVECESAGTKIKGCSNGSAATSPQGRGGCCTTGQGVGVDHDCGGFWDINDHVAAYVVVQKPQAQCIDYTLTVTF